MKTNNTNKKDIHKARACKEFINNKLISKPIIGKCVIIDGDITFVEKEKHMGIDELS